ncbi:gp53-like domain-containing protein, partial [Citrobacter freundii]|nr:hypothetical protein [Citrobacter freundii]EKV2293588.1 hypothetical protein [Citrobacter freundii]
MALSLLAANNAQTVLAAGISSTATSLTVNAGTGTLFPPPVAGTSFFKLTIIDAATGSLTEIVHVTARAGDVFTIQRGQEGTVPRAWSANDIAANMMTAGTLSYILGNFQPLDPTLTALAALVGVANKLPYFNGDDTAALTDLTQVGRDIIGKSDIAAVLQYLGLPTLGIAGTGDILTALDWQQFNFVPGARYFIKSSDMSNVPAQIVITQPTFNAVMDVIGYDGITRHVDIWFSSTPDEYFSRYQVMIAGHQGSRTFSVRRIWTSSEPVPLSGGGTGASTPAGARSNLELGGLSVEDIAPINKGGTGADNVSSALNNFGIGPIANASEVTAGTSKKLIDAALLKAFLPKRSFQANDVIRIPDQPGGLMVQFGTLTGVSGSDVISSILTFPELFPNACLAVIPVAVSSNIGGGMVGVQVKTPTRSNADIFIYERNGGAIAAHSVQYIAIGW